MPRLYHRPPKYCLHKGTKQATVSINGKRVYLGPYGSKRSHQNYQELLKNWQSERHEQNGSTGSESRAKAIADGITTATLREKRRQGHTISIDELALVYRRHAQEYYRKNGKVTREAGMIDEVIRLARKKHGRRPIEEFGPTDLCELRDKMIDDLDWSRQHINKQTPRLVGMFRWAVEKELCGPDVVVALKQVPGLKKGRSRARETPGVTVVQDAIVDATVPHLPEVVADMVRLQRLTGARPGEICTIRPADIDRSGSVWLYVPEEHKTEHHDKQRLIVIGPQGQAVLQPYLDRDAESYCFSPAESEQRRRLKVWENSKSSRKRKCRRLPKLSRDYAACYNTATYRHAVQRVCKRLKIEKWSPNQLRHSAATEIRKKFGLEAAQVVCGHQSADVTQIYAERDLELAVRVAQEVG